MYRVLLMPKLYRIFCITVLAQIKRVLTISLPIYISTSYMFFVLLNILEIVGSHMVIGYLHVLGLGVVHEPLGFICVWGLNQISWFDCNKETWRSSRQFQQIKIFFWVIRNQSHQSQPLVLCPHHKAESFTRLFCASFCLPLAGR